MNSEEVETKVRKGVTFQELPSSVKQVRNLEVKTLNDVWFLSDTFLFSNWEIHQKNTTSALFILALKTNWDTKAP